MKIKQLCGLIFDLDGTLLDSAGNILLAVNAVLADFGRSPLDLKSVKSMIGDGAAFLIQRAFAATGDALRQDALPGLAQRYVRYLMTNSRDVMQPYEGVEAMLQFYHRAGVKLGVCTNKDESATHDVLDSLKLSRYFEFIAGYNTFATHKPDPGHVWGVIEALDVPGDACVFVGDGLNDVRAAHAAKIPCIGITHGEPSALERLREADAWIESYAEMAKALERLGFSVDG